MSSSAVEEVVEHRVIIGQMIPPNDDFDGVIVSTDEFGNLGELNQFVLDQLWLEPGHLLDKAILEKGAGWVTLEASRTRLGVVVTVGGTKNSATNLRNNLNILFEKLIQDQRLAGASACRVWLPLMAVGDGGLSEHKSLEITAIVLKNIVRDWANCSLTVALSLPKMDPSDSKRWKYALSNAADLMEPAGFAVDLQVDGFFEHAAKAEVANEPIKAARYWVFQAVPNRFDLREAVAVGKTIEWTLVNHAKKIEPGDGVFLWQSKGAGKQQAEPGIYGVAQVIATPEVISVRQEKSVGSQKTQYLCSVRVVQRIDPPLTAGLMKRSGKIPDFKMLDYPQGTSFSVSAEEQQVLLDLLQNVVESNKPGVYDDSQVEPYVVENTEPGFHDDRPVTEDELGFEPTVMALEAFVKDQQRTRLPLTIAIDGPWGAGKSSLMKMLEKLLQKAPAAKETFDFRPGLIALNREVFKAFFGEKRGLAEVSPEQPRCFETVYFNAWRYGTGSQLTASLVHAVLSSLRDRWGWRFVFQLGLRRVNRWVLIRLLFESFTGHLLWLATIGAVAVALWVSDVVMGGATVGAGLLFFQGLITRVIKKGPGQLNLAEFVESPDYRKLLGPQHEVEADFRHIVTTLHTQYGCDLAIFIDDLDRCSPAVISEVIEVLNVFFGQELPCLFVLGMHRDMVAASLELAYPDLAKLVAEEPHLRDQYPFGRRFLEKIAQFVVHLPEPGDEDIKRYISKLTGPSADNSRVARDVAREYASLQANTGAENIDHEDKKRIEEIEQNLESDQDFKKQFEEAQQEELDVQTKLMLATQLDERDPVAREVFDLVRFALGKNPRQYKRFFNTLRFENFLMTSADKLRPGTPAEQLLPVAIQAVLTVEYPDIAAFVRRETDGLSCLTADAKAISTGKNLNSLDRSQSQQQEMRELLQINSKLRDLMLLDAAVVSASVQGDA